MLLGVLGMPQLSLLDLRLCGNELGIEVASLEWSGFSLKMHTFCSLGSEPSPSGTPLLITSMETVVRAHQKLRRKTQKYLALCSASLSELHEYEVPVFKNGDSGFTMKDLELLLKEHSKSEYEPLGKIRDLSAATLKEVNRDSLLQKLLTSFYRIKNSLERSRVQGLSYSYLIGGRLRPKELPGYVLNTLESELAVRFREAVKKAMSSGDIDGVSAEFCIDRFEIAFVLSKTKPKVNQSR